MKDVQHKVAAITGAASGIGRALALRLAQQKCHLALSDIDATGLGDTADRARSYGVKVTTQVLDVSQKDAVYAWAAQVVKDFGQVNLLFNNAGVAQAGTVEDNALDDYEWIFGINFWGVLYGTKAFLPHLKASGDGHIINISSIFGLFSQPGMSAYNATKFAVRGITESLRQELDLLDCGVSATCVHPGGIKTNIAKQARMNDSMGHLTGQATGEDDMRKLFNDLFLRTTPEKAAQVILAGVKRNARRVLIGFDAHAVDAMQRLMPTFYQRLVTTAMRMATPRAINAKAS